MGGENKVLKAVVAGAMGRMGQGLVRYLWETPGCVLHGASERADHPAIGRDIGQLVLGKPLGVSLESNLGDCILAAHVVIDFSSPDGALSHVKVCAARGLAYVCGVTGMTTRQEEEFREHAEKTRTLLAPNFSVGIALLSLLSERAAAVLGEEYDVEIVEAHHRHKVDAPSGTALALGRSVARVRGWDDDAKGPKGCAEGPRGSGRVGFHALRGGDVVGEHEVRFLGEGEHLSLKHWVTSRTAFVRGALRAALWLRDKEPGLYTMRDLLGMGGGDPRVNPSMDR